MENKTSKYLKYAIGEIVLVVIGILIALQINNWNEIRKEEELELNILEEVLIGLKTDLKDVAYNLQAQQANFNSQGIIINWIESKQPFHDSLSNHINKIHYGTYFQSNESPYQTLKQLGLRTLRNDSVRNQITHLYDLYYQEYNKFNEEYEALSDILIFEASNYFNELDYIGPNMKPVDLDGLRSNNRYLYYLKSMRNYNDVLINQTIPHIIDNIHKTVLMINKEIVSRTK
ncbi:DUF6090 family protein [Aegicerativicinus sediminis]